MRTAAPPLRWLATTSVVVLVLALIGVVLLDRRVVRVSAPPLPVPDRGELMLLDRATLMALPTSGPAWEAMLAVADGPLGGVDLAQRDNTNAGRLLAAALVHARTGRPEYRERVVQVLAELPDANIADARVLSVARQLAGYVLVADLVGYRDARFGGFIAALRTYLIGNHGRWEDVQSTSEDTASNWGAWALASRIAASAYVGDADDVSAAAEVFRRFTGSDPRHGFRRTQDFDPTWSCAPDRWVPINPSTCGFRSGALVEDISRSRSPAPHADAKGLTYSWETLGGATLSATLLARLGYPDVWTWGDNALLRAAQFLQRAQGYPARFSVNQYIPWIINKAYGVDFGPVNPAGFGRQFGYTDWLP
jgi:hypothetical protein